MNIIESHEAELRAAEDKFTKVNKEYKLARVLCPAIALVATIGIAALLYFIYYPGIASGYGDAKSGQIVLGFGIFYGFCTSAIVASEIIKARDAVKRQLGEINSLTIQIAKIKEMLPV